MREWDSPTPINCVDKMNVEGFLSRIESNRIRGHYLRVKRRVKVGVRQGSFNQRVVSALNTLPGKVVTTKTVDVKSGIG